MNGTRQISNNTVKRKIHTAIIASASASVTNQSGGVHVRVHTCYTGTAAVLVLPLCGAIPAAHTAGGKR